MLSLQVLILIWQQHHQFFLRYGLRTTPIMAINTFFLMIVLFYVYPLKFLTRLILIPVGMILNKTWLVNEMTQSIQVDQFDDLMVIYGLGAAAIFGLLAMMYGVALQSAAELELNSMELLLTRSSRNMNILLAIVPLLSVALAWGFESTILAGFAYFLYTPVLAWHRRKVKKDRAQLEASLNAASAEITEQ
ncbi:MAG TPA: hypothetical protein PLX35_08455 [Cyclobacteriaceae bacterium]|nr:hypothetical protein [Cyclobacteriaceae bacterium]